jgi:TonB family protein
MEFPAPIDGEPRVDEDRAHSLDPYYQFLTSSSPVRTGRTGHGASGLTVSLAAHGLLFIGAILVLGRAPAPSPEKGPVLSIPLVWTPKRDAGGGQRGGGGDKATTPAQKAQLVGREAITVPAAKPVRLDQLRPAERPDPPPRIEIPAMPVESGLQEVVGAVAELRPLDSLTRGPGAGPGADGGRGSGIGDRDGNRSGKRDGPGGEGDGFTPGNGVTWPRLVREVKPNYTPDAMRAQVEGLVELEILVLEDGSVGRVSIVRSLDARFGLDEEAINAVRRWRFDPGRRLGKAVATRVGVELSFNLR